MGYIYKITNQINGKVYIGKTLKTIEARGKEHIHDSKDFNKDKRPLYEAFKKYGIENFSIEEIEQCNADDASIAEQYGINKYRSYIGFSDCNGYNATLGGDGTKYKDYNYIFELGQKGFTQRKIAEMVKCDMNTVLSALLDNNISEQERKDRAHNSFKRRVAMIDKDTDEIIKIFNSRREAAIYLGKSENCGGNIGRVCNGTRPYAYGYKGKDIDE